MLHGLLLNLIFKVDSAGSIGNLGNILVLLLLDAPQGRQVCASKFAARQERRLLGRPARVDLLEFLPLFFIALLIGSELGRSGHELVLRTIDLRYQVREGWARLVVGLIEVDRVDAGCVLAALRTELLLVVAAAVKLVLHLAQIL